MYCCIGGHIPKDPVVNRRTGALYEKALITKHLEMHGLRDPLTNETLTPDDLMHVHGGSANAAPGIARMGADSAALGAGATSVPGLLSMLQIEWEALTLEQFSLRQQLATAQQELSLALYKHDAACRVIANLVRERDAALAQARGGGGAGSAIAAGARAGGGALAASSSNNADAAQQLVDSAGGVPTRIADELEANSDRLKATLKRFEVPPGTATASHIQSFIEVADYQPSHPGGVVSCATLDNHGTRLVFTGGADGKVICYDVDRKVPHTAMIGHTKPITRIWAGLDTCISASADGTGRVWRADVGSYTSAGVLRHPGGITDLAVLPTGIRYGLTSGVDGCLRLHDLETCVGIADGGANRDAHVSLQSVTMHPYGLMGGTGSGPTVHLWDVRTMEVDASFALDHDSGNVSSLHFNVDGKTLAVGTNFGIVQIWELRNLAKPLTVLQWGESKSTQTLRKPVSRVRFDESGQFLAVAADQVRVWGFKTVCPLASLATHMEAPTDVSWGVGANWLASCSASDRHVRIFSPHA